MQIIVDEAESNAWRAVAEGQGLTLSEWVRRTLRAAAANEQRRPPARKLAALQRADAHAFPAPDIEQMLDEIARGRAGAR